MFAAEIYQRGATDPPNGGVFQMFPPHWQLSNSVPNGNCQTQFRMAP